jgi:hypothetical protein
MPSAHRPFNPGTFAACALTVIALALTPAPGAASLRTNDVVAVYADVLAKTNIRLAGPGGRELAERLLFLASYYRLDPRLLVALVTAESSWHARAVSPVGALGYGQLMPTTAASLDVDPGEPYENLDGTARYLRRLLNRYATRDTLTRVRLALASYNAGPAAVDRYGGVPPYAETQAYVAHVMRVWLGLVSSIASPSPSELTHLLPPVPSPLAVPTPAAVARKSSHYVRILARQTRTPATTAPSPVAIAQAPSVHRPQTVALETPATAAPEPRHGFLYWVFHRRHDSAGESFAAGTIVGP